MAVPAQTALCLLLLLSGTATALLTSECVGESTNLPPQQCAAWIDFYNATQGDGWLNCAGTQRDPCCCPFINCGRGGDAIEAINLWGSALGGTLPPSLAALTDLTWFNLRNNQLRGAVPLELGKAWAKLEFFNVQFNHLSGGMLPAFAFSDSFGNSCYLFAHALNGSNTFNCPWPPGALQHCQKFNGSAYLPITDNDCTP